MLLKSIEIKISYKFTNTVIISPYSHWTTSSAVAQVKSSTEILSDLADGIKLPTTVSHTNLYPVSISFGLHEFGTHVAKVKPGLPLKSATIRS